MTIASQKQGRLVSAIVLKEGYVASLRSCLLHWAAITERTLQMLGRYHTREEILGTLRHEEEALRVLKYKINFVDYEVAMLRQRMYSSQDVTRVVEESQDSESVWGDSVFDTDEEVDMVWG